MKPRIDMLLDGNKFAWGGVGGYGGMKTRTDILLVRN